MNDLQIKFVEWVSTMHYIFTSDGKWLINNFDGTYPVIANSSIELYEIFLNQEVI